MKLSLEEAVRVVGEFEGYDPDYFPNYAESLDALVPVWEKLGLYDFIINTVHTSAVYDRYENGYSEGNSVAEAACLATAKAIVDLKEWK